MSGTRQGFPRILYIVYWGAGEANSWILPHVKELARLGAELTLVTFEKAADLANDELMAKVRAALAESGIDWIALRYHKRPKLLAKALDYFQGCARVLAARLLDRPDIVHARTFSGGLLGMTLAPLLGARLIFHNEGFYPDEQVDSGVWKAGSLPHRVFGALERRLYSRADGVVTMSDRSADVVRALPAVRRKATPVIASPAGVDLRLFAWPVAASPWRVEDELRLVYVGSVGGRYLLDALARFVAVACRNRSRLRLRVLTGMERDRVAAVLGSAGVPQAAWSIDRVPNSQVPEELSRQHAGLNFWKNGLGEHGASPTKIGEYWASGLPVVTTPNIGDIDDIVNRERVGVIVRGHDESSYQAAFDELLELLADPELPCRCRRAAETHYALEAAIGRQFALYQEVLTGGPEGRRVRRRGTAGLRTAPRSAPEPTPVVPDDRGNVSP